MRPARDFQIAILPRAAAETSEAASTMRIPVHVIKTSRRRKVARAGFAPLTMTSIEAHAMPRALCVQNKTPQTQFESWSVC